MKSGTFALSIGLLLLQACVSTAMPPGVHAVDADGAKGCASMGIAGNDGVWAPTTRGAMEYIAKAALDRDANAFVILDQREGSNGVKILAEIYYCDKFK